MRLVLWPDHSIVNKLDDKVDSGDAEEDGWELAGVFPSMLLNLRLMFIMLVTAVESATKALQISGVIERVALRSSAVSMVALRQAAELRYVRVRRQNS